MSKNFEHDIDFAKRVFLEKGELHPMFILNTEKGAIPVVVVWRTDEEKRALLIGMQLAMIKHRAHSYTFMMEMWFKGVKDLSEHTKERVADYDDKQEGLLIAYVSHDVKKTAVFEIKRNPLELIEKKAPMEFRGLFLDLLPSQEQLAKELTPEQDEVLTILLQMGGMKEVPIEMSEMPK